MRLFRNIEEYLFYAIECFIEQENYRFFDKKKRKKKENVKKRRERKGDL